MIFLSGLFTVAFCAFAVAVGHLLRARKSRHWPMVPATILDANFSQGAKGARANISYRYVVAGRHYTGDRVVVGWMWGVSGGSVENLVARHPRGSSAHVAVDPEHPTYSVLTPGVNAHQIVSVVVCSLVLSALAAVLGMAWAASASP